jgi:Uma2 family endonuclease
MAEHIGVMGSRARLMTADELLRNDVPHKSTELVRGMLVVREPPGGWHGHLSARLGFLLGQHVYPRQSGMLFGQDTAFLIERDPDTVRAADMAFVAAGRAVEIGRHGYVPFAPDLVVEILSPGDHPGEVLEKIGQWLTAGSRLVWVIDPDRRNARVHRADGSIDIVPASGSLESEDLLPGFSCPLVDLLG